jgi:hypothetical protein
MLNPQSMTKADRGFNNLVIDLRASFWRASALDIVDRRELCDFGGRAFDALYS